MATLTGHVSHEEMAAERAARRVKGVHAIAEGIEVRCLGETSDEEIARRAPNILKWYAMVPQDAVQVTVQKGRVTDGRRDLAICQRLPSCSVQM
jgi:osmotically-inducible protein OsmY